MTDKVLVLGVTLILFYFIIKRGVRYKTLVVSVAAGIMSVIGGCLNGEYILYSLMDGLIAFMMWYSIIAAVIIFVGLLKDVNKKR